MSNASLAPEWDEYLVVLREDAHQLLAWGYADTRPELAAAKDEYEMTGILADGMDARINSPETDERFIRYSIHNERPTSPSGELGKKRPKLDIQIELCGVRPKRFYTIEAKRLRDDAGSNVQATMRHYLGEDGIQRFVKGRYAQECSQAAMLGCIQARDAKFWFSQVEEAFDADTLNGRPLYALVEALQPVTDISFFTDERFSVHERKSISGTLIRIFHVFIDCRREAK